MSKQHLRLSVLTVLGLSAAVHAFHGPDAAAPAPHALAQEPAPAGGSPELEQLREWTEQIQPQVERLRGLQFKRPVEVRIAGPEEFAAYARAQFETLGPAEVRESLQTAAKLLGLYPVDRDYWEDSIEVLESQVGGYYDPSSKTFSMMRGVKGPLAKSVLSHELVHALEDQHFEIGGTLEALRDNADALAAYHAVVEGSAMLVQNQWTLKNEGGFTLDEIIELTEEMSVAELFEAEPFIWLPALFSYMGGQTFLHKSGSLLGAQMQPFQRERLDAAFGQPPVSTEQILHPEKYWDDEQRDLPRAVTIAGADGWERLHTDVLGELQLALVGRGNDFAGPDPNDPAAMFGIEYTTAAASGWDGDRMLLLTSDDGLALVLASTWDSEADRDEWAEALERRREQLTAAAVGIARAGLAGEPSSIGSVTSTSRGTTEHLLVIAAGTPERGGRTGARSIAETVTIEVD